MKTAHCGRCERAYLLEYMAHVTTFGMLLCRFCLHWVMKVEQQAGVGYTPGSQL